MKLVKMTGLGNTYIYADCIDGSKVKNPSELAKKISDVNFGVGADGLIIIGKSDKADFSMDIYNADGSRAQMCGNGIRCVGKYVFDAGYTQDPEITVETLSGVKSLSLIIGRKGCGANARKVCKGARVDMGEPVIKPKLIPVLWNDDTMIDREVIVGGKPYKFTAVSMGNPHVVTFVKDVDNLNLAAIGPLVEHHSMFPERINTEFAQIVDKNTIRMRVWERGAGETMACGTGASATLVAAVLNGLCERKVSMSLSGGTLLVEWDEESNHVFIEGPAEFICEIVGFDA